jgi:Tol biopolymer transport system component
MTSMRRSPQDLGPVLAELYDAGTPDYRDDLVQRIAATRQRPAWTFPERWLPMDLVTTRVPQAGVPWRALGVLALLAALLAVGLAVYVGTQTRLPDPFGLAANGRIAYIQDGDVLVRDRFDSPAENLISGPEIETAVLFSPLGDRVAVFREVEGGEDLWVADADGRDLIRLGGPYRAIDWVEWSPDQQVIAMSYDRRGVNAIELVSTDGSGSRRIARTSAAMSPTFRPPDGRQLLFRRQDGGRWGFYLLDLDRDAEPKRLAIDGDGIEGGGYDLTSVAWSPTGDRIVFHTLVALPDSQLGTAGFRIHTAAVDPGGEVSDVERLELDPRSDDELNPIFTPTGDGIIFQRRYGWTPPQAGGPEPTIDTLHLLRLADGRVTDLGIESRDGDGVWFSVAPDGASITAHLVKEGEDWLIDPATGTARKTDLASTSGISWQRRAP